jgi:N-acetylmuramoyl-L-alanine amidase-like protein
LKTETLGIEAQSSHNGSLNGGPGSDVLVNNDLAAASKNGADLAQIYSRVVERYAMFFDRPEARLRFLNNTLTKQADRQDRLQRRFRRSRLLGRTRIYDWLLEARCYSAIFEEMRAMYSALPKNRRKLTQRIQAPFSARLLFLIHQSRHAFYGAAVIVALLSIGCIYTFGAWSARGVNAYLASKYKQPSEPAPAPSPTPSFPEFVSNKKVYLFGKEGEYEKWSNGCNISTKYETDNHPRAYYAIPRGSETNGDQFSEKSDKIVGILYHTPENPMFDLTPDNTKRIQNSSRELMEDVRNHKKYNYLINRIGDIYRIVRDDQVAYHAGDSLWADANNYYVWLNESFIGVCFESKFDGASSLDQILTEPQINSGRRLTEVLRAKYNIDDANCTTHGLVAVAPDEMLIARHHDWVHFFPFEAMGLSNKYKVRPPSIIDYGFTHNEEVLAKKLGGKLWEGAAMAEEEFNRRAAREHISPDDLRSKLRDRYLSQRNKTLGLHAEQGDVNNPRVSKNPAAGESTESGGDQGTSAAWKALTEK